MTFLLAHLSDPHLPSFPPPRFRELWNKRLTGWLNWKWSRAHLHRQDNLAALVEDIQTLQPDHIALTGDVLNLGLRSEFACAVEWLTHLAPREKISFVPGNHDAYTREAFEKIPEAFGPWMWEEEKSQHLSFPYLHQRGPIGLIGLSSAIPTPPFFAGGAVGWPQFNRLKNLLHRLPSSIHFRILLIHHPPYIGGASWGRGLRDAALLEAFLKISSIDLVLHGHNHCMHLHFLKRDQGNLPIIGVESASAQPGTSNHCSIYNLYHLNRTERGWTLHIQRRGLSPSSQKVEDLSSLTLDLPYLV